jgi:hypothetical protein
MLEKKKNSNFGKKKEGKLEKKKWKNTKKKGKNIVNYCCNPEMISDSSTSFKYC